MYENILCSGSVGGVNAKTYEAEFTADSTDEDPVVCIRDTASNAGAEASGAGEPPAGAAGLPGGVQRFPGVPVRGGLGDMETDGPEPDRGGGLSEDRGRGEIVNQRKRAFCEAYLISGNATDAAREAGYSPRSAWSIGQRLLTFDDVLEYLERRNQEISAANTA